MMSKEDNTEDELERKGTGFFLSGRKIDDYEYDKNECNGERDAK